MRLHFHWLIVLKPSAFLSHDGCILQADWCVEIPHEDSAQVHPPFGGVVWAQDLI